MPRIYVAAKAPAGAPAPGFFRCGRFWPNAGEEAEVDATTLERLQAEPMLVVQVLDAEVSRPRGPGRPPKGFGQPPGPKGSGESTSPPPPPEDPPPPSGQQPEG